uniref:Ig-like domain-containing protein n=1 Tax=Terrapene triunguis TaxID=2587831 RepID=A0A674JTB3_9SAUR
IHPLSSVGAVLASDLSPPGSIQKGSHPKPSISVSPGGVIPVGGNVTIRCWHQLLGLRFLLYKAGAGNYLAYTDPAGSEAEFPITSARREHGGSYTCRYSNRTGRAAYLEPSDPVHIIVTGEGYPKPNISMSPRGEVSLGGAATVWCRGQRRGVWFVLNKERHHFPPVDSDGFGAVFPISNVSREHGGSYSCSYHSRSEPFAVSYPSDPMELVVRGEGPGSAPSISISPSEVIALGGAVTIRCQCRCGARRLFLYKGGIEIRELDAAGDGGEFTIPRARSEPSSWSDPSDIVGGGGVALGGNITIQCQATQRNMRFLLYKVGSSTTLQDAEPARDLAEFPISNVSRRDAGRYRCYYHTKSDLTGPAAYSEPSDPVQIIVAGEGPNPAPQLPAPHPARPRGISLSPGARQKGRPLRLAQSPTSQWWCCAQNRGVLAPILPVFLTRPHSSPRARNTTRESWPPASPSTTLTTSPHSPPRARDRTQVSLLPALPAEKPGSDWTLETGLACLLLGSRALGPQGLGLIRVSCC